MSRKSLDDLRYEKKQIHSDFCEENGLEHTTSCYVEQVNDVNRNTFWVCRPGCPTRLTPEMLKRAR